MEFGPEDHQEDAGLRNRKPITDLCQTSEKPPVSQGGPSNHEVKEEYVTFKVNAGNGTAGKFVYYVADAMVRNIRWVEALFLSVSTIFHHAENIRRGLGKAVIVVLVVVALIIGGFIVVQGFRTRSDDKSLEQVVGEMNKNMNDNVQKVVETSMHSMQKMAEETYKINRLAAERADARNEKMVHSMQKLAEDTMKNSKQASKSSNAHNEKVVQTMQKMVEEAGKNIITAYDNANAHNEKMVKQYQDYEIKKKCWFC